MALGIFVCFVTSFFVLLLDTLVFTHNKIIRILGIILYIMTYIGSFYIIIAMTAEIGMDASN